ncbi:hypothetical protein [Klebsiella pneumoniae]|uniref:hypothetical protein n=1 Tax=Klebsiella pneumoniae TaxID=573 RepID=UPI000E2BF4E0|nr:hypothetical protein [Klebsiella pneumoniae]UNS79267.1 hypothetical protein MOQ79_19430 [Klebsiella pneumoniae]SYT75816.1 Uncharacterised protein [Klebsiella pneumoniae]HBR5186972.1 hypothetical protein [Klebsiella pneumoniae]
MTITLQAVNELIAYLESAGELSIKETKVMALAKAYQQLAAENVALKQFPEQIVKFIGGLGTSEMGSDTKEKIELAANRIKTPVTDRIVAEAEARGVEKFAAHLRANDNGASVCKMIALGADDFAKQLREGADK